MSIFKRRHEGSLMDVIRCDEPTYLIWKWRPKGAEEANTTNKENAIRYGSSLRVKDGEVAVFVYPQKSGVMQDYIEGPFDQTIKTANFPVLSSIVGAAFGGASPFQAEIYFINLAGLIQVKFGVPFFDVADSRNTNFTVPVAVRGSINFRIKDYKEFIKLHRLIDFDLEAFKLQIRDAVCNYAKSIVANIPFDLGIPVIHLERKNFEVSNTLTSALQARLSNEFGVTVTSVDVSDIELDKESEGYRELKAVTTDIISDQEKAKSAISIHQMERMADINMDEYQRAARLGTESTNLAAHQIDQATRVGLAGAEALGKMGAAGGLGVNLGNGGGFNPASMMAGMAMGGAIGRNVAGMMNNALGGLSQPVPPPPPQVSQYHVAVNGQSTGPYQLATLSQMAANGQLTRESLVWKAGMANWMAAGNVPELSALFGQATPPVPPIPPVPPAL
ncbi:MAG: SPFH domain-containing protein [Treponema sp.]|nr:SPFH domain-containing protein [Treponema sp.]